MAEYIDIKSIRDLFHLTQEELAQRMGVTQSTISMWEGAKRVPSGTAQRLLLRVCKDLINERFGSKNQ